MRTPTEALRIIEQQVKELREEERQVGMAVADTLNNLPPIVGRHLWDSLNSHYRAKYRELDHDIVLLASVGGGD